jgi:hypothetical protein
LFSIFRPIYRRAASGEVDGIGGGRGQSLGTEKPTFTVLVVEAICEVCFSAHRGLDGGGSRLDATLGIGYHFSKTIIMGELAYGSESCVRRKPLLGINTW